MERADQPARGTALAVMPVLPSRVEPLPSLVIDHHSGFARLRPPTRMAPVRRQRKPVLLLAVAVIGALLGAIAFRDSIVAAAPRLGGLYEAVGLPVNLIGIELDGVRASRVYRGGYEHLRVEGALVSVARESVALPAVEVVLLGADGVEVGRRSAVAAADVIAPGGTIRFAAEFPDLPAEAATITVRLGNGPPVEVE